MIQALNCPARRWLATIGMPSLQEWLIFFLSVCFAMCCTMSLTINHIFFSGAMYPIYNDNVTYRQGTVQKKLSHLMQCQSSKVHCAHAILSTMNFSKQKLRHFFLLIG